MPKHLKLLRMLELLVDLVLMSDSINAVPVDLVLHGVSENEDGMPTVTRNGSASPKVRFSKVCTCNRRKQSDICFFFISVLIWKS